MEIDEQYALALDQLSNTTSYTEGLMTLQKLAAQIESTPITERSFHDMQTLVRSYFTLFLFTGEDDYAERTVAYSEHCVLLHPDQMEALYEHLSLMIQCWKFDEAYARLIDLYSQPGAMHWLALSFLGTEYRFVADNLVSQTEYLRYQTEYLECLRTEALFSTWIKERTNFSPTAKSEDSTKS